MHTRFDSCQDNDIANDLEEFDGISYDPLDAIIALEDEMGMSMSIVEAVRLARGICRERRADAELEFTRQRKLTGHGHH